MSRNEKDLRSTKMFLHSAFILPPSFELVLEGL